MKILYNRYTDKLGRLFIPIAKFKSIDETEAIAEKPTHVKLLNVLMETTNTIPYADFESFINNGSLKQIIP